jgi:hypothetical protein
VLLKLDWIRAIISFSEKGATDDDSSFSGTTMKLATTAAVSVLPWASASVATLFRPLTLSLFLQEQQGEFEFEFRLSEVR